MSVPSEIAPNPSLTYRMRVNSVLLSKSLVDEYKITRRKSLTIRICRKIPDSLFFHYLRGIFDGDGCIFKHKKRYDITIYSGNKEFIDDISSKIHYILRLPRKKPRKRSVFDITYYSLQAEKLAEAMYSDNGLCLLRKKRVYDTHEFKSDKRWWLKPEEDFLRKNHGKLSLKEIAKSLGKTYQSVNLKSWRMGLGIARQRRGRT